MFRPQTPQTSSPARGVGEGLAGGGGGAAVLSQKGLGRLPQLLLHQGRVEAVADHHVLGEVAGAAADDLAVVHPLHLGTAHPHHLADVDRVAQDGAHRAAAPVGIAGEGGNPQAVQVMGDGDAAQGGLDPFPV